ncbi:MAG: hypothetical protein Q3999_02210 [Buchananella hordeovulneris]|nr:hypothetical protein [Buchananella hordeovulneris]
MAKTSWARGALTAAAALAVLGLGACANSATPEEGQPAETQPAAQAEIPQADGPRAAADRQLAARQVSESADGKSSVIDLDLGNVTAGEYSAPLRGQVIVPKTAAASSPLVVISHLRAPNCSDNNFAYPCAAGAQENRYDRGMVYLGEALAAQGYAVLIPDLGGIFIGADVVEPYDQNAMWRETVGRLAQALDERNAHEILGVKLSAPIDMANVGLVVHSRSGTIVEPAVELFGEGNIKTVFAYGPSYDTVELENISPVPADISYLALVGDADADVGPSANLWLGHYIDAKRQNPASVVSVPGLGHMWVNRVASAANFDDRIGCDLRECPSASEHERILTEIALDWLGATLLDAPTQLPLRADQELPAQVAGVDARWLAHTPGAIASVGAKEFKAVSGESAKMCQHADPMNPVPMDNPCPEAEEGVVQILTPVNYLTDGKAQVKVEGAKGIALQISPSGSYEGKGTAVTVVLSFQDGSEVALQVPEDHPALANRAGAENNGIYQLGTVRIALPEAANGKTITAVHVTSDKHPVELRSVDFWK